MKIVVVGGGGRIGEKLVYFLRQDDYAVLEASRSFGVDTVTGQGVHRALEGAEVVVDVSNSPSLEGDDALHFFEASSRRLLAAGAAAGVRHHVVLSMVGAPRLQASPYFRGKMLQEDITRASGVGYSILRSTQFFEGIAGAVQDGGRADILVPPAQVQPISAFDLAEALADLASDEALNRTIEIAGPERFRLPELAIEVLTALEDGRRVIADRHARYFGAELDDESLLPGPAARIARLRFEDWLRQSLQSPTTR